MEPMEQNTTPPAPENPMPESPKKEGSLGATAGIILILILIALGGIYYFTKEVDYGSYENESMNQAQDDAAVAAMEVQGTSDEVGAIEADLEATDFSEIDQMMLEIDAELQGSAN